MADRNEWQTPARIHVPRTGEVIEAHIREIEKTLFFGTHYLGGFETGWDKTRRAFKHFSEEGQQDAQPSKEQTSNG